MPCTLFVEAKRHSGIVLDLSANGLFVQTSASPETGESLRVEIVLPGVKQPSVLQVRVARRKLVPPRLRTVAQGGVGLRIERAPEEYFTVIAELLREQVGEKKKETVKEEEQLAAPPPRRISKLQRKARKLALRQALGPRRPAAEQERFRLRISHGARSRILDIDASSEDEARARALAEAGKGWAVLRCEKIPKAG